LQAALAHVESGEFKTAASLFRAVARYIEGIGEEKGPGEVIAFPSPACRDQGARLRHAMG
jgi:hypothetical protein